MRRKKSLRSTSLRFTEIGSPVYFTPVDPACCVLLACCCAALTAVRCAGVAPLDCDASCASGDGGVDFAITAAARAAAAAGSSFGLASCADASASTCL